ncbi:hypothetical protein [Nannocystis radixulma]|uniref:HTTM domain-containing protein n=1 Tax=Nannocystis radixulma TaxID=2995305 RepID=A0ABT5BC13_9BACT|nr:hypothetical protein [Nannocystis radixulma]MDC0671653.1 hypothetical protein [Nannocystis radixulma]
MPGERWQRLFEREPALFAAGLRATSLAAALWLSLEVDLRWASLPKGAVVSTAGLVVPTAWWSSPALLWSGRALLWGGAVIWLFGHARKVRYAAGWATALGMLTLGSLYWEDLPWFRHKFVPPLWLLVLLAAAEHAPARPGQAPRWVREGAVFVLASFYAGAGLHKLLASGWRWADGTALQLWLWRLGDGDSLVRAWAIVDARVAAALAATALLLELAAVLLVPLPRVRPWLAAGLVGLHVGIDQILHIDFRPMIALVIVVLMPWPEWWQRLRHGAGDSSARVRV